MALTAVDTVEAFSEGVIVADDANEIEGIEPDPVELPEREVG